MGIRGLQNFVRREIGLELVNLSELAELYRCETKEDPVLFYEIASSYCIPFLSPVERFICGGLKKYKRSLEIFLNKFSELDINVKVVFDGLRRPCKDVIWIERKNEEVSELEKLYSGNVQDYEELRIRNALPIYLTVNLIYQTSDKCEYTRAIYKGVEHIVNHIKNSNCFAVLTNDSNFIPTEGARYCLSFRDLDLNTMTTYNYKRNNLAKYLNISTSQLPLLGSLLPFYLPEESLKKRIEKASKLVKKFPSEEKILQSTIKNCQKFLKMKDEDIKKWIQYYKFFCGNSEFDIMRTGNKNWDEILSRAEKRHTQGVSAEILGVLSQQTVYLGPDFSNVFKPMPDSALLPLRKKLYGILLFEYPFGEISVTEHCYEYCEDIKKARYFRKIVEFERIHHPGLLEMWSEFPSENIQKEKREVFCRAIDENLNPEDLKDIQLELLFPFLAAFYLFWKSEIKFQEFEIRILLIQAILVNSLSEEKIEEYTVKVNVDAIDLSSWFIKTVNYLNFLSYACGQPFCLLKTNLINFFDGKVLQHVYNNEIERRLERNSVTWSADVWGTFKFLKNKLYEIGLKCGLNNGKISQERYRII